MQVRHKIDSAERIVILRVSGPLDDEALQRLPDELEKIPGLPRDFSMLIDLREADGREVTSTGVRGLSTHPLVMSRVSRRAVVVPTPLGFGMARMYDLLREPQGGGVRAFRDYDEARRWLRADAP